MTSRWTLCVLLVALGCSTPRGEPYRGPTASPEAPPGTIREPSEDQLLELLELCEAVFVGRVAERQDAPSGVNYKVDVLELLSSRVSEEAAWPHAVGDQARVTTFLYRPGAAMRRIGPLKPPSRYLFFVSRMEREGWWLNLEDTAGLPLPEAEETLRALRRLTRPASADLPEEGSGEEANGPRR